MNFDFNDDQQLLRETVRRFLDERQSLEVVRNVLEDDDALDKTLWAQVAELGFVAMLVPEEFGGGSITDQPIVDLVVYAEELGRCLNPGPFLVGNVAADAIARSESAAIKAAWLERIAAGEAIATYALGGDGTPELEAAGIVATPTESGYRLDGEARYVHEATNADLVVVSAVLEGAWSLFAVSLDTPGVSVTAHRGMDLTRRFGAIRFDKVEVLTDALLGGADAFLRSVQVATVLKCAEATGAASTLFDRTVAYLRDRVQFGRTIASYQAIKHRLADLQIEVEAMRAATYYAALALSDGLEDAAEAVHTAGAWVPEAFAHQTGESLQLHGGIGFTWEHDVHLFVRRSKSDQPLYGDPSWHRQELLVLVERFVNAGRN